jgi:hypothetical protein
MPRTTDLPKAEILARYVAGVTVQELATDYGRSFGTMRENLHRWGATLRRRGPAQRYTLNETYFDKVVTECQAYWLGFLLADGSVGQTGAGNFRLRVELSVIDVAHLEKLRNALGSDAPVRRCRNKGSVYTDFCAIKLCDGLISYGCVPKKTAVHGTPKLPGNLYRHFYRGVFDGDGALFWSGDGYRYELVGAPEFVMQHQQWLMRRADVKATKMFNRGLVLAVRYTGSRQVERIMDLLYDDAAVYLDRKFEVYKRLKGR